MNSPNKGLQLATLPGHTHRSSRLTCAAPRYASRDINQIFQQNLSRVTVSRHFHDFRLLEVKFFSPKMFPVTPAPGFQFEPSGNLGFFPIARVGESPQYSTRSQPRSVIFIPKRQPPTRHFASSRATLLPRPKTWFASRSPALRLLPF